MTQLKSSVSISDLRRSNRDNVLRLLARHGSLGRLQLCEYTGLTGAGISRITRELIDAGLIREGPTVAKKGVVGRRQAPLEINPGGAYVIGMTITANRKSVALADVTGQIIEYEDLGDLDLSQPGSVLRMFADAGNALIERAQIERHRFVGVGVGLAVPIRSASNKTGRNDQSISASISGDRISSSILGWHEVPVAGLLGEGFDVPIKVEPRSTALLRAELRKAGISSEPGASPNLDVFLINVGLGIGAAAHLGGKIVSAGSSGLGNIAHLKVSNETGHCHCGRTGCLDALAAGAGVLDQLHQWTVETRPPLTALSADLRQAVERARGGDTAAREAFRAAGRMMGRGVDAVATLLDPRRIILSGEIGRQPDYVQGVRETLAEYGAQDASSAIAISNSTSAEASSCIGLEEFVFSQRLDIARLMSKATAEG